MHEVTELICASNQGDKQASTQLLPLIYQELRRMARAQMARERSEHTLNATALVHEVYLRLFGDNANYEGRSHFFAAAAEAMRRILIDHARSKNAQKRGGASQRVDLEEDFVPIVLPRADFEDLLALDDALDRLASEHPSKAELVKLLYFAGLNLDEAAEAQGIGRTTAYRHWQFARAWLFDAMAGNSNSA